MSPPWRRRSPPSPARPSVSGNPSRATLCRRPGVQGPHRLFRTGRRRYDRFCSVAGQRTWTVMIYLNEPEAGGAPASRRSTRLVQPETGKLLAWDNRRRTAASIQHAPPRHEGARRDEVCVTKWYREKPWG
jgi:hypothetical protein